MEEILGDGQVLRPMIVNKGPAYNMGWYVKLQRKNVGTFGLLEKR